MKKIVCLVLALAMLLVVGSAMAEASVSASYADGVLSVSGSGIDTYYMVLVDGNETSRSLTPSSPSVSFPISLEDGRHTVTIYSDVAGSKSTSVQVGEVKPTVAPATEAPATEAPATEAPTTAPVDPTAAPVEPTEVPAGPLTINASYRNGVVSFTVSGLKVPYGELWLDGASTGVSATNGSGSFSKRLAAGPHTLLIYTAAESDSTTFTVEILQPTISASYNEVGKLVYTVGAINNPSEIWLDGAATSKSVTADGTYTLNVNLTEGSHTIMVYDATNNLKGSASFTVDHIAKVVPGKAATCTETGLTDGEVCEICGKELKAQEVIPMIDHTPKAVEGKAATCTETGLTDGEVCEICGKELKAQEVIPMIDHTPKAVEGKAATCTEKGLTEASVCAVCGTELKAHEEIPALGHDYKVVDKSNGRIYYKCSRCGDTFNEKDPNYVAKSNKNAYGNILKDTNNVFVDYTAEGNGKILVIKADLSKEYTSEIGMYLDADLIAQIQKEGYTAIEYINGEADIVIELDGIASTWFDTNSAIWCYVFSTDPAAAEGTLVKVEAQISGTDKVPATAFSGVTLKKGNETIAITENGNY